MTTTARSATSRWIPASAVDSPTAVTRTRTPEWSRPCLRRPARPNLRHCCRLAVIIDSSKLASPSTISPSAGTDARGRTTTTSPSRRCRCDAHRRLPSTRSAVSGRRAASESRADVVWAIERISIQWPRSMMTMRSRIPPHVERMAEPAEGRSPGRAESDGDAERDEYDHSGLRAFSSSSAPVKNGRPTRRT